MKKKMMTIWMIGWAMLSATGWASDPNFVVDPVSFSWSVLQDSGNPADKTMTIHNLGQQTMNWSIVDVNELTLILPDWLAVSPLNGSLEPNEIESVSLMMDVSGLSDGQYSYSFNVGDVTVQNKLQTVTVDMELIGPQLDISSNMVSFFAYEGDSNPDDQALIISNPGGGTLNWQLDLTDQPDWLTVGPISGSITHNDSQTVGLGVDMAGLPGGQYSYSFEISDPALENSPQIVTVSLDVTGPRLEVLSNIFSFSAYEDGVNPENQTLSISNSGGGTLNWLLDLTAKPDWLTVGPASGSLDPNESEDVTLMVDISSLSSGQYSYSFEISDSVIGSISQTVIVALEVVGPKLAVSSNTIAFAYFEGDANPAGRALTLTNSGGGILNWMADLSEKPDWLNVTSASGLLEHDESENVGLSVEIEGLSDDWYLYTLVISDPEASNSPQNITIFLEKRSAHYGGGSGTEDDPYQIWTPNHLNSIALNSSHLDKCFKVMADIDMSAYTGTQYNIINGFSGVFDGGGYTIRHLSYTNNENTSLLVGLFGSTEEAVIQNVNLQDISISSVGIWTAGLIALSHSTEVHNCHVTGLVSGARIVGGLIAGSYAANYYVVPRNYSSITNCSADCTVLLTGINSYADCRISGLVGLNEACNILNCSAEGTVSDQATSIGDEAYFGGLVGHSRSGTLRYCRFDGNITLVGTYSDSFVGGIVGSNYYESEKHYSSISDCYVSGEISGKNNVGGILGYNPYRGTIRNCHTTGIVQGENYVGGIAGYIHNFNIIKCSSNVSVTGNDSIGGLFGFNANGNIVKSCAVGSVQGNENMGGLGGYSSGYIKDSCAIVSVNAALSNAGGLAGEIGYGTIENCYAAGEVTGTATNMGGFVGDNDADRIVSCFWDVETSGQTAAVGTGLPGGITGQTTEMMQTLATFTSADWDFDNNDGNPATWELLTDSYPKFPWQPLCTGTSSYAGGDGSRDNPYQIASEADFNELTMASGDWYKYFILTDDIDLSGMVYNESPIAPDRDVVSSGFQGVPFNGHFDGNGHTIRNLHIQAADKSYIGLFGKVIGSQIKDLYLENAVISGYSRVGVIAGTANRSTIDNCHTTGTVSGDESVAGLIGYNIRGIITSCSADCLVTGRSTVGGLTAVNGCGTITHSKVTNTIAQSGLLDYSFVGGITACNSGDIEYSFCDAEVVADGNDIMTGGITAVNYAGDITSVFAKGTVSTQGSCVFSGGLIGCLMAGSANYSYSTAAVTAIGESGSMGGLMGENILGPGSIHSCFWDIEASALTYSAGGKPVNSQLMKSRVVFQNAGWANKGWVMDDGVDVPRLAWEGSVGSGIPIAQVPFAGSGTYYDPYRIYTAEEFALLSWYEDILDKYIILMNDLDLSGVPLYPIGDLGPYIRTFDGKGHTLYNVKIHQPGSDYIGLFSMITIREIANSYETYYRPGIVKNLKLESVDIIGNDYVGALVGVGISVDIESCSCSGSVKATGDYVGGLIGYADRSSKIEPWIPNEVINCYADASVDGVQYVGGLIGFDNLGFVRCYASGPVTAADAPVGGLAGYTRRGYLCFWDVQTSGQTNGVGQGEDDDIFGKTTAEMMTASTYTEAGWDFLGESVNGDVDLWRMCTDGVDYPHFRWEYTRRGDFVCGDGVDLIDFAVLAEHWQSSAEERYDANGDGVINLLDLEIIADNWLQ